MNIFVANVSFRLQSEDLKQLFQEYGEVESAKIVMDRDTGRSKGYGFVEMSDDEAAMQAISELNEVEVDGKIIVVKKANPRKEGGGRPQGNRGGGGGFRRRDNNSRNDYR